MIGKLQVLKALITPLSRHCTTIEGLLVFSRPSSQIVEDRKKVVKKVDNYTLASFCIVSYKSSNEFPGIMEYTTSLENTSSIVQ